MQGKQDQTLSEITDVERAYHEAQRISRELKGLIDFLASRLPTRASGKVQPLRDPRTGKPFRSKRQL